MKTYYVAFIALFMAACAAGLTKAERAELAKYRESDREARLAQAQADGYQPPGPGGLPTTAPTPPDVTGQTAVGNVLGGNGQGVVTGAAVLRGERQLYVGAVGTQPRQATIGPKLKVVNNVCDGGSRDGGLNCADRDQDGWPDYNSVLALMIEGKPVVCQGGPQGLLMPQQTCYVETNGARYVHLTVVRYRMVGTHMRPFVGPQPTATYSKVVDTRDRNITLHDVTESKPWSR